MALKKNTSPRTKTTSEKVAIKAKGGQTVIWVSQETAEMMLRNKGEFKLVKAKAEKPSATTAATPATPPATPATPPTKPEWPKGTQDEWAAYAQLLGLSTDGLDRTGIRDAIAAHEAAQS